MKEILLLIIIGLLMMIWGDMPKRVTPANPHSTTIVPKGNFENPTIPRTDFMEI